MKEEGVFLEAEEIARLATEVASEKQARDIAMLDVRDLCSFADYFVICSGETKRHLEAIWQGVDEILVLEEGAPMLEESLSGILDNNHVIRGRLDGTLFPALAFG